MTDFKIFRASSEELFPNGELNPRLIIEEGCWYLCTDTAELFVGTQVEGGLVLKRVNESEIHQIPVENLAFKSDVENVKQEVIETVVPEVEAVKTKVETVLLPKVEEEIAPTVEELKAWVENKEFLQHIDLEGYATEEYVNDKFDSIEIPEVDLSKYSTTVEVQEAIAEAIGEIEFPAQEEVDLTGYATEEWVESKNYLSEVPEGFATEEFVNKKIAEAELADKEADLEAYYTKSEVDAHISEKADKEHLHDEYLTELPEHTHEEYLTELPEHSHDEYLTEHQDISGKADKVHTHSINDITDYVMPELPSLEGYATKQEVTTALAEKANETLFTTAKFVKSPINGFAQNENISGLTIAELFAKLLGLADEAGETPDEPDIPDVPVIPETPEEIVEHLTNTQTPMYSQDENGNLVETPFVSSAWTVTEAAVKMDGVSTIYTITDDSGTIIEAGYQEATNYNEEAWLTVALPSEIKNVKVKMYDPDVNDWVDMLWKVTVADEQTMEGYTIWTVPEEYEVTSGDTYRFVIVE